MMSAGGKNKGLSKNQPFQEWDRNNGKKTLCFYAFPGFGFF